MTPLMESRRMAILAECDICGTQHRVKDALIGRSIRCKECGVQIKVPKENIITPETFFEEDGWLRRREPNRETGVWPWIVAGLVSSFVAAALIVVVWVGTILMRVR